MSNTSKKFFKVLSLSLVVLLGSGVSAFAAARLSSCDPTSTSGSGLDGSDCDAGLICDRVLKVCVNTFETPCKTGMGCAVGNICKDDKGTKISGTTVGTCQPDLGTSAEHNAISDILCNLYKFVTGKTGRIVIGIIFVGAGGTFLLGKMQLGTVIAIALGCGCIFGASAIVSVFVGKGFDC